jgi:hypothetical protein
LYQWGESIKGSQSLRFWRLMPKGEKVSSPKKKDHTTTISKNFKMTSFKKFQNEVLIGIFQLVSLKINFQIGIYFKNPLESEVENFIQGKFIFSQRTSI